MAIDKPRTVVAEMLDSGAHVPQVTVTLDVASWEFIFANMDDNAVDFRARDARGRKSNHRANGDLRDAIRSQ